MKEAAPMTRTTKKGRRGAWRYKLRESPLPTINDVCRANKAKEAQKASLVDSPLFAIFA
jgi:hypothetical protein